MAEIPGQKSDVFYGDAEKALPDWRVAAAESGDDEEDATPEEKKGVAGVLGFDPPELWKEGGGPGADGRP